MGPKSGKYIVIVPFDVITNKCTYLATEPEEKNVPDIHISTFVCA